MLTSDNYTVNEGTQTIMAADEVSGAKYPRVKVSLGADGAAVDWTGNIPSGTITRVEGGTVGALASGTITNGTVSTIGIHHPDEFGTVVSTGTNTLGTIRAAVTGSVIYVTGLVISVGSATNVEIASGGTSTPIAGTFFFNANGGAVLMPIDPPLKTASGSALVYKQSAAISPMTITCVGYID